MPCLLPRADVSLFRTALKEALPALRQSLELPFLTEADLVPVELLSDWNASHPNSAPHPENEDPAPEPAAVNGEAPASRVCGTCTRARRIGWSPSVPYVKVTY